MTGFHLLAATAIGLVATLTQTAEAQCPPNRAVAGSMVDVQGPETMMTIDRAGKIILPIQFASVCEGDIISLESRQTFIKIRSPDSPLPSTLVGKSRTTIGARSRPPTVADNAFAAMIDRLMPDLGRFAKHAHARTERKDVFWDAPGLTEGTAILTAGVRELALGWDAPQATYRLEIRDARTGAVIVVNTTGNDIVVPSHDWAVGDYSLSLYRADNSAQPALRGAFKVVSAQPPSAPETPPWAGAELAAATHALNLIASEPAHYGFEALQIMKQAPREGLNRDFVYDAIRGVEKK